MKKDEITCPYCKNIILITSNTSEEQTIKCSKCECIFSIIDYGNNNSENFAKSDIKKSNNNSTNENNESSKISLIKILPLNVYFYNLISIIIGIVFIILGSYLLLNFLNQTLNLGIGLIIIGISFFFLTSEIKKPQKSLIMRVIISERITIMFAIWIFISLLITDQTDYRLFLITIIIGFLVIKEITRSYVTEELDKRMKIFIIVFFLAYLMIIGNIIIAFLSE